MRFKIDWASFIVGTTFTVFRLFYFAFEGVTGLAGLGGLYLEALIHGGAYFQKFTEAVLKTCKAKLFNLHFCCL